MKGLLMIAASLRPAWQYSRALSLSFMCYFSTPMLQLMTIFMQSPQYFFYSILFFSSSDEGYELWLPIYLSIMSTIFLALIIYSMAFSCFFISLRMAALLRQVWIISYFSPFQSFLNRYSSIWMAQETAFTANANFFIFLYMHAKLLNVRIFRLPRLLADSMYLEMHGVISRSTALVMILRSILSSSCLKFYMVTLLIFRTKFVISCDKLKGTALMVFLSRHNMARCSNFYSFSKHSIVISQPPCLCASTTFHIIITTVASLTSLVSSNIFGYQYSYIEGSG